MEKGKGPLHLLNAGSPHVGLRMWAARRSGYIFCIFSKVGYLRSGKFNALGLLVACLGRLCTDPFNYWRFRVLGWSHGSLARYTDHDEVNVVVIPVILTVF